MYFSTTYVYLGAAKGLAQSQGVLTFTVWWSISWNGLSFTGTVSSSVSGVRCSLVAVIGI